MSVMASSARSAANTAPAAYPRGPRSTPPLAPAAESMNRFQRDTAVTAQADGRYAARVDGGWWIVRGPNGGYVGAIILRALMAEVGDAARAPRTMTIHYLSPPVEGPAEVETVIAAAPTKKEEANSPATQASASATANQKPTPQASPKVSPSATPTPEASPSPSATAAAVASGTGSGSGNPPSLALPPASAPSNNSAALKMKSSGLLNYIWLAMGFGFLALLTPCVFPMIPITVSFFTKREQRSHGAAISQAPPP